MTTIFDACAPRPEVLEGELRDDIFAARLRDVMEGKADPVYGHAGQFFQNTYATTGLRDLLGEALGRLSGMRPNACPVIRLETAFGGGKTHNLIALYHIVRGNASADQYKGLVDPALVPKRPVRLVAGVVGSDMEPANGLLHKDTGIRTYTLAGEIAHQLGGADAYGKVKPADLGKTAVATNTFEQLIGDEPCLIMLDELGRFMRDASAVATPANPRVTLAETSVATLMSLLEFASSKPHVVVVLTLADSSDAFGRESDELRGQLDEAHRVTARQERVLTPSNEAEMSAIVTHRLFAKIDRRAAEEAARAYARAYDSLRERGKDLPLPDAVFRSEYQDELRKDFPFHPSFLGTLRRKVSTIPSFQQTRGALRLLARSVRALWHERPRNAPFLFHIHHLNLGLDDVANDLTSRLERPAFRQVIEADVVSSRPGARAHAQAMDAARIADQRPPYAYRLSSAIFLHSLTQGIASGVDRTELAEAVLEPGDDPSVLARVLQDLEGKCWFLDYDGDRYRFKTEPSLNKLVADEAQGIPVTKAKAELANRIKTVWKSGIFESVPFPSEADEIEDDTRKPKLTIVHFDAASARETDERQAPPELALRLFEYGGSGGYRTYKNNLLFLVADADQVDRMVDLVRRHLAIERILGDTSRLAEFTEDQRKKLKAQRDAAELDVRVGITRAYRFLFYPTQDAPAACRGLKRYSIQPGETGDVRADQSQVVLRTLKSLGKALTSDDKEQAAAWLKSKAWPAGQPSITTEDLRKEFCKRIGLPILFDLNQLKKTIKNGIAGGEWLYYSRADQIAYGSKSSPPLVELSDETELWEEKEARLKGLKVKGEETQPPSECPVCLQSPCACGDVIAPPPLGGIEAEGAPREAFTRIRELCGEREVAALRSLEIRLEGSGATGARELKSIGLAIPQLGQATFTIDQNLTCEPGSDVLRVDFHGSWDRYKRLKQVTDAFAAESKKLAIFTALNAEFPQGLDPNGQQFETIAEVFAQLEIGKIHVRATPSEDAR